MGEKGRSYIACNWIGHSVLAVQFLGHCISCNKSQVLDLTAHFRLILSNSKLREGGGEEGREREGGGEGKGGRETGKENRERGLLTVRSPEQLVSQYLVPVLSIRLLSHAAGGHVVPIPLLRLSDKLLPPETNVDKQKIKAWVGR